MKGTGLSASLALAALVAVGCSVSDGPVFPDDSSDGEVRHYHMRTSPDSVLYNLELAYETENVEAYVTCLSDSFVFFPSPGAVAQDSLPPYWDFPTERTIHENMFAPGGDVHQISLELNTVSTVEVPGPDPQAQPMWEYTCSVDLRVCMPGHVAYMATAPSLFVFQVDPDAVGPDRTDLWEIVRWHDLDEGDGREDSPVLPTTWGTIKAMFM